MRASFIILILTEAISQSGFGQSINTKQSDSSFVKIVATVHGRNLYVGHYKSRVNTNGDSVKLLLIDSLKGIHDYGIDTLDILQIHLKDELRLVGIRKATITGSILDKPVSLKGAKSITLFLNTFESYAAFSTNILGGIKTTKYDLTSNTFKLDLLIAGEIDSLNLSRSFILGNRLSFTTVDTINIPDNNIQEGKIKVLRTLSTYHLNLSSCRLPDSIDFSNMRTIDKINLLECNFSKDRLDTLSGLYKRHVLNLAGTDISKFILDYQHYVLGPDKKLTKDKTAKIYLDLRKNFKDYNQEYDYELCDIDYHNYLLFEGIDILQFFPKVWNNYGYKKVWIFGWTFGSLIFFSIFSLANLNRLNDPHHGAYHIPQVREITSSDSLASRYFQALVYTSFIFFPVSISLSKVRMQRGFDTAYVFFVYLFGLICIAYMANYILTK